MVTASRLSLEQDVFQGIVAMCRQRIITRARFVSVESRSFHGAAVTKAPVQGFLRAAIDKIDTLKPDTSRAAFRLSAVQLVQALDRCKSASAERDNNAAALDAELWSLIEMFCNFLAVPNLERILMEDLEAARPRMDRSTRTILLKIAEKMAQYKTSAARLAKMARRYAIIRRSYTLIVRLDDSACSASSGAAVQQPASLQAVLHRLNRSNGGLELESLCSKLGKNPVAFAKTLSNCLVNAKVHAEVQLIWHLEKQPQAYPPRVIASNKDACHMCNAFIAFHGKYTVPRSHGKIYPGWRLPAQSMLGLSRQFVAEVERMVVSRAHAILQDRDRRFNHPFESTVFTAMGSMTTVLTAESCGQEAESSDSDETIRPDTPPSVGIGDVSDEDKSSDGQCDLPRVARAPPDSSDSDAEAASIPVQARSDDPRSARLVPGDMPWQSISQGETRLAHDSQDIRLYVEYTAAPGRRPRELSFRAEQRAVSELKPNGLRLGDEEHPVYDMAALREVSCNGGDRVVRLRVGGQVLDIELDEFTGTGSGNSG